MSNYDIMIKKNDIKEKLEKLEYERYTYAQKLHNLQKCCAHDVVIHYNEDPLSLLYNNGFFMGHIYCPHCEHSHLKIKLKTQTENIEALKYNCEEKTQFILEASGFRGNNIMLNLKEVLNLYTKYLKKTEERTPYKLISFLKANHIPFYEGFVSAW